MTEGPPPADAGPSNRAGNPTSPPPAIPPAPHYYAQAAHNLAHQGYPYYNYTTTWTNPAWPPNAYPYGTQYQQPFPQGHSFQASQHQPYAPQPQAPSHIAPTTRNQTQNPAVKTELVPVPELKPKPRTPSPSPPPPALPRYWDAAIKTFLVSAGCTQALKAFEADMLVMNPDWEKTEVPPALEQLSKSLSHLLGKSDASEDVQPERPLEERKLDYMHLESGVEPRSQTSINKSIALFLARNRARNDTSNRNEFLHARKRRRVEQASDKDNLETEESASCARTDAKTIDRDVMMKFDIVRNEEGPLRRTIKTEGEDMKPGIAENGMRRSTETGDGITAERHPGLDERLRNIETHVAVRYVPSPPVSLLHRIKFIEDHIVSLEKEYPPWAALHFNQPRRGWPPPPRPTPIIVPSHLTSTAAPTATPSSDEHAEASTVLSPSPANAEANIGKAPADGKGKTRQTKSSLHRAVMERLEVQRAMSDLRGEGTSS